MLKTVRDTIKKHKLFNAGTRILAAVSGGADSMSLLSVLSELRDELGIELRVIHVNHSLRGEESERDADFVRRFCKDRGIRVKVVRVDVMSLSKEEKISTEEAARLLRYRAFEKAAGEWESEPDEKDIGPACTQEPSKKQVLVAVAHNMDDNAETILMQLARGSGLKGTSGMSYRRDRYIRPLLDVSREHIERYLIERNISWVTDSTNLTCDYARNRIRHDIMPRIVSEVNAGAVLNITRAGRLIGQADEYISQRAQELLSTPGCVSVFKASGREDFLKDSTGTAIQGVAVSVKLLKPQPSVIRTYMIRSIISRIISTMKDVSAVHIEDASALVDAQPGKRTDLPYALEAVRDYESLIIRLKDAGRQAEESELSGNFTVRYFAYEKQPVPDGPFVKWFDADRVGEDISFRFRKTGDYLMLGKTGKKMLGAYMTDIKLSRDIRDTTPVMAAGSHVVWLVGYRISESFKVRDDTVTIMEVTYTKGVKG